MADEAFALSPINARASLPTDADYDAICDAFMETARGRWFLGEYAKRNRNADTHMVLDAVARIEATLASQKPAPADPVVEAEPPIDLWPALASAFARTRIEIAQRLVRESDEQAFETIRGSVETIKSVSWALRERGFDQRICDIFDVQVNAITDGYTGLLAEDSVASEMEAGVLAAFDALIQHVESLTRNGDAQTDALDAVVDAVADAMGENDFPEPVGAAADTGPAAETTAFTSAPPDSSPPALAEPAPAEPPAYPDAAFHEIYGDDGDIEFVDAAGDHEPAVPPIPTEPEINKQRLYEAKAEPYRSPARPAHPTNAHAHDGASAVAETVEVQDVQAGRATLSGAPAGTTASSAADTAPAPIDQPKTGESASLGRALIAGGVIQNPSGSQPDPLAPFRRMSQAEKVAFFT